MCVDQLRALQSSGQLCPTPEHSYPRERWGLLLAELYLSFLYDNLNKVLTEFTVSEIVFLLYCQILRDLKPKNSSKKTGYKINCEMKTATLGIFTTSTIRP